MMAKPGDTVEIQTPRGLAYAQVTLRAPLYGTLIRVIDGFWDQRPQDVKEVVDRAEAFFTFFPVAAAVRRGIVANIGSAPIPERARGFPLLRQRGVIRPDGTVSAWWLWDGDKKWRVGQLSDELRDLSIAEVINDTLLVERLNTGWRPRDVV